MRAITMSVRVAGDARRRSEATQLARQKIAEALIDRSTSQRPDGSGTFPAPFETYTWTVTGSEAGLNTTGELTIVECTVRWVGQGEERAVILSTLVSPETDSATDTSSSSSSSSAP